MNITMDLGMSRIDITLDQYRKTVQQELLGRTDIGIKNVYLKLNQALKEGKSYIIFEVPYPLDREDLTSKILNDLKSQGFYNCSQHNKNVNRNFIEIRFDAP